ncbi:MAG: carboxypeptidase-like regulatory domain-containing protein, partial [Prevotellaceae bacterium]|nr:carboxypeptidase-like regulatory domain-containing protein [Prevotellaceae bacterium]
MDTKIKTAFYWLLLGNSAFRRFPTGCLISIGLLCPLSSQASGDRNNDANINGHAIDAKTLEHLPFVSIVLKGTTIGIATDATGHYFLKDLPFGEFTLAASYVGYKTAEKKVKIEAHKTMEINFELEEELLSL